MLHPVLAIVYHELHAFVLGNNIYPRRNAQEAHDKNILFQLYNIFDRGDVFWVVLLEVIVPEQIAHLSYLLVSVLNIDIRGTELFVLFF